MDMCDEVLPVLSGVHFYRFAATFADLGVGEGRGQNTDGSVGKQWLSSTGVLLFCLFNCCGGVVASLNVLQSISCNCCQ